MTSWVSWVGSVLTACCSMETLDRLVSPFGLRRERIPASEILLKDCQEVARTLGLKCEHVKFNKSLCKLLATTYSSSLDNVLQLSGPAYETIVAELRRVMLRGEAMVKQCTDENWWRSVINTSDSASMEKRVLLHLDEFLLYVKMLRPVAENGVAPAGTFLQSDVLNLSMPDVEKASRRDIESLLSAVESYKSTLCPRGDVKLAEYVLNRFRAANSDHGHLHLIAYDDVELGAFIGKGSFGAVRECKFLGVKAAAKVFVTSSSKGVDIVQKEAKLQAGLQHPNVVQFIGYAAKRSQHIIVSELMSMDLQRYLEDNVHKDKTRPPLSLLLAVDIMLQIAEAMKYLHQCRVMHRDLKANNILINVVESKGLCICPSVQVKVTDFGFSKLNLANSRFTSQQTGATPWRAPEVFEDEKNREKYTNTADVYSYAMVFFEVLTGEIPFAKLEIPRCQILDRIRAGERPILPPEDYCPEHLSAFIKMCWATSAADRPNFVEICQKLVKVKVRIIMNSYPNPSPKSSTPQRSTEDFS